MNTLDVKELYVDYTYADRTVHAVKGVSLSVRKGQIAGIIGESGCGKSSLMMSVLGMTGKNAKISSSCILINGEPPIPGKNVAAVFQSSLNCLNPSVTIGRQLAETVRMRWKCSGKDARLRSEKLLEKVGIRDTEKRMRQYPFELSGGMRQRVVIAMALACEPELILADEPTTSLDPVIQAQILSLLGKAVRETGASLLLVSHDPGVTAALCEYVYVMKNGEFAEEGDVRDIFYAPQTQYTENLLKNKRKFCAFSEKEEQLLKVENLTKNYAGSKKQSGIQKKKKVHFAEGIQNISLQLYRGETYALLGESGSGKSTFARILSGIESPDRGEIYYRGNPVIPGKMHREIQHIFQDPYASLNPCLTVKKALLEAVRGTCQSPSEEYEKVENVLQMTGLTLADAEKYPGQMSGGQRQRAGIARALIVEPELLICDEAFASLDAASGEKIMELIYHIQKEKNLTCLLISHDIQTVRRFSRRVGILYLGNLIETGRTKEVCTDPWHPYTKLLLESVPAPDPFRAPKIEKTVHFIHRSAEKTAAGGCPFSGICGYAMDRCSKEAPSVYHFDERSVACFLYSEECGAKMRRPGKMTSQI